MTEFDTDAQATLAEIKGEIAKLGTEATAVEDKVKSMWQRYEVYLVAFVAFVAGLVVMHFVGK